MLFRVDLFAFLQQNAVNIHQIRLNSQTEIIGTANCSSTVGQNNSLNTYESTSIVF
jgi:hypothetical protein